MWTSRCVLTSSTTHLAVAQQNGQMGSIQNSIAEPVGVDDVSDMG